MATPAAVLSLLVKAEGATAAAAQLTALEATAKKASAGMDAMGNAARKSGGGLAATGSAADKAAGGYAKAGTAAQTAAAKTGELEAANKKGRAAFDDVSRKAGLLALGVGAIGAAAVKTAGDYQQSMNVLQSVSGATGEQMDKLGKLAIKLGADTKLPGTSAKDASEAMTEMVKAGVSLGDTMKGVRGVLVLSAAAGVDNARAAEIASNALNAFKLRGKDVNMVVDQLANTANSSSVEINDVADSFKMAAAVFNAFQTPTMGAKKAMTELNVAIGLLGNAGIKGSDAGTSLKQALLQLTGPSGKAKDAMQALYIAAKSNAAGEKDLQQVIRGTGQERADALKHMTKFNSALSKGGDIAFDAHGKMRSLKDTIALVAAGTKKMTAEEKDAYLTQIFGSDATRAVTILLQAQGKEWDRMEKAVKRHGAAQDLANSKMKGFKGSIEALKSSLETMAIGMGTKLLPALTSFVKVFTSILGLISPTGWLILIGVIGTLATTVWAVNTAIKVYEAVTKAATAAQWLWNAAMEANPAFLVVTAMVALGVALVIAYKKIDAFRDAVDAAWGVLKSIFGWIKDHWELLLGILVGPFALAVVEIIKHAGEIKDAIVNAFKAMVGAVKGLAGTIAGLGKSVVNWVVGGIKDAANLLIGLASWWYNRHKDAFLAVKDAITGLGGSVLNWIVQGIHAAAAVLVAIGGWAYNRMKEGLQTVADGVRGLGESVLGWVIQGVHGAAETAVNVGSWLYNRLKDGLQDIKKGFLGLGDSIVGWIVDGLKGAADKLTGFLNDIIGIINKIPGVEIPKIKGFAAKASSAGGDTQAQAFARGGVVSKPMAIVGEEAPRHKEYVIPTNPAYRGRALGLFGGLAKDLNVPGFAMGGILGDMPSTSGLGWLAGTGKYVIKQVMSWAKDKLGSLLGGALQGGTFPGADALAKLAKGIDQANRMNNMHTPYLYGGGHNPSFSGPWDCSGAVSAVLHSMGLLGSPITTDGLKVFGEAGDGKYLTIGVRGSTGRNAHTMMKIGNRYFESGGGHGAQWVSGWDGDFPIHRHIPGLAKGGILSKDLMNPASPNFLGWGLRQGGILPPFGGSYAGGGTVPGPIGAPRTIIAHGGEKVGSGGGNVYIENAHFGSQNDAYLMADRLAWRLSLS